MFLGFINQLLFTPRVAKEYNREVRINKYLKINFLIWLFIDFFILKKFKNL